MFRLERSGSGQFMLLGTHIFNVYSSVPLCLYWGLKMHKLTKLTKFTQGLTKVCM